jgi:peptide/nickel transport system permease protein
VPEQWHRTTTTTPVTPTGTGLAPLEPPVPIEQMEAPLPPPTKRKRKIGLWFSIGWIVFVTLAAILAPILPLKDPINDADFLHLGASWGEGGHLFGTDDNGRDVLSRVIWGARASLLISVGSILFAVLIGGFFGLIAGYRQGRTDGFLSAIFNILLAFPALVLALTLVSVLSPNTDQNPPTYAGRIGVMVIAIGIVSVPVLGRITRANTLAWSQREFVMASRAQGAKSMRVMFREVLPNVLPAMLSIALLGVAIVIVIEGGLALFGLSVPNPSSSWGNMIAGQIDTIDTAPNVWMAPSMFIFFTVLSLNYLGDWVRSQFDVREAAI